MYSQSSKLFIQMEMSWQFFCVAWYGSYCKEVIIAKELF